MKYILTCLMLFLLTSCSAGFSLANMESGCCASGPSYSSAYRASYVMTTVVDVTMATAILTTGDFENGAEERTFFGTAFIVSAGIGLLHAILSDSE